VKVVGFERCRKDGTQGSFELIPEVFGEMKVGEIGGQKEECTAGFLHSFLDFGRWMNNLRCPKPSRCRAGFLKVILFSKLAALTVLA
jgi:hypothetical protein